MRESSSAHSGLQDIDQPLGLSLKPPRNRSARSALPLSSLFGWTLTAVILASSSLIAFRDDGLQRPVQTDRQAASAEQIAAIIAADAGTAQPPASLTAPQQSSRPDGPAIIKLNPDSSANNGLGSNATISDPASVGQDLRIAHLPDRALLEDSAHGPIPTRAADGRRAFDVYAMPWSGARGARIALIIGGLGVSQSGTQQALQKLPKEVTLAFASGGNSLSRWMNNARQSGHELIMQVPLEPYDYPNVDPGRSTLLVDVSEADNRDNLHWTLARTTNYVGVMNYMGARFSADQPAMAGLMEELGARGLMYLDDGSSARSLAENLAAPNRVPFATSDMVIDGDRGKAAILAKLDDLERTARAKGFAIGTGSAFDVTVDSVASWAAEVRKRGIEIVPISALANDPERR